MASGVPSMAAALRIALGAGPRCASARNLGHGVLIVGAGLGVVHEGSYLPLPTNSRLFSPSLRTCPFGTGTVRSRRTEW